MAGKDPATDASPANGTPKPCSYGAQGSAIRTGPPASEPERKNRALDRAERLGIRLRRRRTRRALRLAGLSPPALSWLGTSGGLAVGSNSTQRFLESRLPGMRIFTNTVYTPSTSSPQAKPTPAWLIYERNTAPRPTHSSADLSCFQKHPHDDPASAPVPLSVLDISRDNR
jgi:hypothetical protein